MDEFCGSPFWTELPSSSTLPNVSVCFQHTVLVWLPFAVLVVLLPVFFFQTAKIRKRFDPLPLRPFFVVKMVIHLLLLVNSLFVFAYTLAVRRVHHAVDAVYPLVWAAFFLLQCLIDLRRLRMGAATSGIQHLTLLILAVCSAPEFYQWVTDKDKVNPQPLFIAFMAWWPLLILQLFLYCFADARRYTHKTRPSKELDSSALNRLTLWWFSRLPLIGARKDLELEDLFELNRGNLSEHLGPAFDKHFIPMMKDYFEKKARYAQEHRRNPKMKPPEEPSVVYALFKMFKYELILSSVLKGVSDTIQFANPFLLNQLLNFVSAPDAKLWQGISYALLMLIASEIRSLMLNHYFFLMMRIGVKLQTALTAAVYKKTMRLSNSARREKTVGEIINLMAIDIDFFQLICAQLQQFWSCPYQICFCLGYLFYTLGYSASPGVVIMACMVPTTILGSIRIKKWQMRQMKLKDERTKMVNEVLNGIKVIKLYAWEKPMEAHIASIRNRELALIKRASLMKNVLDTLNSTAPFLVSASTFATYIFSSADHKLTPQIAFVSLTLFNQLRSPMTLVAMLIAMMTQVVVSNRRLKAFFSSEELDEHTVNRIDLIDRARNAVEVVELTATWEDSASMSSDSTPSLSGPATTATVASKSTASTEPLSFSTPPSTTTTTESLYADKPLPRATLVDVDFTVRHGGFVAVVGTVGSGKSSLLSALLGELTRLRGSITVAGRVTYVPQQAWIQNLTLRDNILFGKPFNKKLYDEVIYACALKPDLAILPDGDRTEIGEKGINLSGGQKARIALARAVYQQSDVYLLDDPLSAVDAHVGRHIFQHVVGPAGMLAKKSRILVTHGLTFTRPADTILVLTDGLVIEKGNFDELVEKRGIFAKLLDESLKKEEEDDEEGDSEDGDVVGDELPELPGDMPAGIVKQRRSSSASRNPKLLEKQQSVMSRASTAADNVLIEKENVEIGRVKTVVYMDYVRATGIYVAISFVGCLTMYTAVQSGRSFWLSAWSNENDPGRPANATKMAQGARLGIYAAFGLTESTFFFSALASLIFAGLNASRNLHTPLVHNLLRSPISFFDTTPLGRILNRCSKDIDTVDSQLPLNFRYFIVCILQVASTLLIISISTPVFTAVVVPLTIIYIVFLRYYVPTSRQLKRLESVHRSPIYSHFGESISGAASIRAYQRVDEFCLTSEKNVDTFIRCRYLNIISNRWLAIRLEFLGNLVIFFAALFAAFSKEFGWGVSAGIVGVSVSYALNITEVLNFAVRQISEIESNIVSVERIKEYCETPNEAEWELPNHRPAADWPSTGVVTFDKYATRYRPGLDLVLKKISARVAASEKIGIVGRTGAGIDHFDGKSSFALALFRMIEPAAGRILIDGVDIAELGLHDLRKILTIIPQDPVLFSGSLRFNLDPFGQYDDAALYTALELAHLRAFVAGLPDGLEHRISEGGENISVGQRQLVCLARAALRHSRILVLDEATAAVDLQTDALIQNTIRTRFRDCTVFTIAHRLNTILDYDRIMVLDKGEILEFDSPAALQSNKNSAFSRMLADAEAEQEHAKQQ